MDCFPTSLRPQVHLAQTDSSIVIPRYALTQSETPKPQNLRRNCRRHRLGHSQRYKGCWSGRCRHRRRRRPRCTPLGVRAMSVMGESGGPVFFGTGLFDPWRLLSLGLAAGLDGVPRAFSGPIARRGARLEISTPVWTAIIHRLWNERHGLPSLTKSFAERSRGPTMSAIAGDGRISARSQCRPASGKAPRPGERLFQSWSINPGRPRPAGHLARSLPQLAVRAARHAQHDLIVVVSSSHRRCGGKLHNT